MTLPVFTLHHPDCVTEVMRLREEYPDSMFIAGGTDLIPGMENGLHAPEHVIDLSGVIGLQGYEFYDDGTIWIGAMTRLCDVAGDARAQRFVPALTQAASLVGGPQHRNRGTIGGNVMLDTRCRWYNQCATWREALGGCLKTGGPICRVINKKACVAARSGDTVAPLIALNAVLDYRTVDGEDHRMSVQDAMTTKGLFGPHVGLPPGALLIGIIIPPREEDHRSVYYKVRKRDSFDFPELSIALSGTFMGPVCVGLRAVVSSVLPKPRVLRRMNPAVETQLEDQVIDELAASAGSQVHPIANIPGDPEWRQQMVAEGMREALRQLRDGPRSS